jgi:hypothetical protein
VAVVPGLQGPGGQGLVPGLQAAQCASSTDILFLNSLVNSNTEEAQNMVSSAALSASF